MPEGITRAHSIAEFYCVLTGPGLATIVDGKTVKAPVPPQDAEAAIRETFAGMRYRDVKASEAIDTLADSVQANIQGKSIHDWMHCEAAELANCETLVTLNLKDFTRMRAEHFIWQAERIEGLTPLGRATVRTLRLNHPLRLVIRRSLRLEGVHFE